MAAREGAAQVSKARPVYVFCAGQVVAAMEVCAAMPAPAATAAPATAQVMYLRFLDCRWLDMKDPAPVSSCMAKTERNLSRAAPFSENCAPGRSQASPRERQKLSAHLPQPLQSAPDLRREGVPGAVRPLHVQQQPGERVVGGGPVA